jgi:hypothetical protein
MSTFSPIFRGDGDPQVGFSADGYWNDWDPAPDGVFAEDEFDYFGGPPNQANFLMTLTTQSTGTTEIVKPSIVTITRGKLAGGNVGSLHFTDQNYYKVNKFIVLNLFEPAIQITMDGFSPSANLTAIQADVTAKVNSVGLQQTIYLFNFTTQQFVQLDQRNAPTTDTHLTIGAPGTPTDYVDVPNGNVVRMKITYKQTGITQFSAWGCSIDLANWLVTHP